MRRAIIIILDSLGIGELPDAAQYGDVGAATLQHVAQASGGLSLPTMQAMGLGNIAAIEGVPQTLDPDGATAAVDKLMTLSAGKDTITGHWELMGVISPQAFPTYPHGFPAEIMDSFTRLTGYGWLGNYPASGTEIINELGQQHIETGKPIIYTSGDSVFQVAAHNNVISLDELYRICQIARDEILVGPHACARVIARPFIGNTVDGFVRTADRHDYALAPPQTALDRLQAAGIHTLGIGKINDIYGGRGLSETHPTASNEDGMQKLDEALFRTENADSNILIFANLVDFDMLWGHRRDYINYGKGLEEFDQWLASFLSKLRDDDLLIITADHGCDPTHVGSDHTREFVPLLVYPKRRASALLGKEQISSFEHETSHALTKVATIVEDYLT